MPSRVGSIPAIAVPMGRAMAIPEAATAVAMGRDAASPLSPITANPVINS